MSAHIVASFFVRMQTSPAECAVIVAIASHANVLGQNARVSYEVLAAQTGFSVRWVVELVKRLEGKALLRVRRVRLSLTRCAINVYTIVRPWVRALATRHHPQGTSAHPFSDGSAQRPPQRGREEEIPTPEDASAFEKGMPFWTPGSLAWRRAQGLPDEDSA